MVTEEQHIALVEIGNQFRNELTRLVGEAISKFPEEIEYEVLDYLQDRTSIYSLNYSRIQNNNRTSPVVI